MGQVVKKKEKKKRRFVLHNFPISDGMHNFCNELKHILRKWKSYSIYIQIWNNSFGCQLAYIHLQLTDFMVEYGGFCISDDPTQQELLILPAGMWCQNDVAPMLMWRNYATSTSA